MPVPSDGAQETLWHFRSALNVAALVCRHDRTIAANYNLFLARRKVPLAAAYADEQRRFAGNPRLLDRHLTQIYNHYSRTAGKDGFCRAARAEAAAAAATANEAILDHAVAALDRLEAARAPARTAASRR